MIEKWKDVVGYEGLYSVSNLGRIKSLDKVIYYNRGGNSLSMKKSVRILKQNKTRDGYFGVCLFKDSKRKYVRVHRVVAETFIKNPKNKPYINHKDGNKLNNYVNNLEWVTGSENILHALKTGLWIPAKGEQRSKFSEGEVLKIRKLWDEGSITQIAMAKKYKVGKNCIHYIIKRNTWKHI
jgi:hypothetical protein